MSGAEDFSSFLVEMGELRFELGLTYKKVCHFYRREKSYTPSTRTVQAVMSGVEDFSSFLLEMTDPLIKKVVAVKKKVKKDCHFDRREKS
jgi:hypothetical protein